MGIKSRKLFAILVVSMMILTMLPMSAFAASTNTVDKVPQVASDHVFTAATAPILRIVEKNTGEFGTEVFRLNLENAEWIRADMLAAGAINVTNCILNSINILSDTVAEITITGAGVGTDKATVLIPLITEVVGDGEAKVTVDSRDSSVSSGTFVFANSAEGKTIASISDVNSFSRRGTLATIEVDETRIGALGIAAQNVKIKLPPKFTWNLPAGWGGAADITFSGGLAGTATASAIGTITGDGTRTLEIDFTPGTNTAGVVDRNSRGSIFLNNLVIVADRDAALGDVYADFDGTNITTQDVVIAKNMEYNIKASIPEVKEAVAGKYDNKTAKITIEEELPGAMIANREISVVFPEWVKVVRVRNTNATGGLALPGDLVQPANSQNEIYFVVNTGINNNVKSKYQFELELSVEADKEGDIVAEIFGAGMEKQELTVAKAVPPVIIEIKPTDVKIGVQNQLAPDITITETAKGRIDNDTAVYDGATPVAGALVATGNAGQLTVTPPAGFTFTELPKVAVTDGNLELGPSRLIGGVLTLQVDSSSTRASTIKISNIKLTLDRTVPEGDFNVNVGGGAIVKNNHPDATNSTVINFNKNRVMKTLFGKVITPAPGEIRVTSVFTIGGTTYTVVEENESVEKTMDVAPYIKDGRTFLPLRYVANALDVNDDNIIWDPVTKAVTIFKGDRIAQVTIGSKTMLVNGVTINMDVAPEITDERTMLPIRWMGQALGATIDWNAEAREVTVKQ